MLVVNPQVPFRIRHVVWICPKRGCCLSRLRSGYIDGDVLSVSSDLDQDAARAQTSFDLQLCPVGERNTGGRHIGRVGATEYHRSRLQGIHYASSHTKRTDPGLIGFAFCYALMAKNILTMGKTSSTDSSSSHTVTGACATYPMSLIPHHTTPSHGVN